MKNRIITIGNKLFCRVNRTRAKKCYAHGIPLIKIKVPEKCCIGIWGLDHIVMHRESLYSFGEIDNIKPFKNPGYYVPLRNVVTENGKIIDATIDNNFDGIF